MKIAIRTIINGREIDAAVKPNQTLLEWLRDDLRLRGSREGCGVGVCGSCTVLVDGRPVSSCLMLATNAEGKEIQTIEGLAQGDELDPVQQAFLEHSAFQCGYCTSGMIMATKALLAGEVHMALLPISSVQPLPCSCRIGCWARRDSAVAASRPRMVAERSATCDKRQTVEHPFE